MKPHFFWRTRLLRLRRRSAPYCAVTLWVETIFLINLELATAMSPNLYRTTAKSDDLCAVEDKCPPPTPIKQRVFVWLRILPHNFPPPREKKSLRQSFAEIKRYRWKSPSKPSKKCPCRQASLPAYRAIARATFTYSGR